MQTQRMTLGTHKCDCEKCKNDVYRCGNCGNEEGEALRIQGGYGALLLCISCVANLRSKIDAFTILVEHGIDTKQEEP